MIILHLHWKTVLNTEFLTAIVMMCQLLMSNLQAFVYSECAAEREFVTPLQRRHEKVWALLSEQVNGHFNTVLDPSLSAYTKKSKLWNNLAKTNQRVEDGCRFQAICWSTFNRHEQSVRFPSSIIAYEQIQGIPFLRGISKGWFSLATES